PRRNDAAREQRVLGRRRTEGAVRMPEPITELEKPDAILGRHDLALAVQVREIRDARAEAMVLALADVAGALVVLELAEIERECDLLLVRELLIAKDEHDIGIHP